MSEHGRKRGSDPGRMSDVARYKGDLARDTNNLFDGWMQIAVRYFVLANAGAAVATLSFMGASGSVPLAGILSLFCFVAGIAVGGFVILIQVTAAWRGLLSSQTGLPAATEIAVWGSWTTRLPDKMGGRVGTLLWCAGGLFLLGAFIGLLALLFGR